MFFGLRKIPIFWILLMLSLEASANSIQHFVDIAIQHNLELQAQKFDSVAAHKLKASAYTLDSPRIGLARLNRGNETDYWTVSQKLEFPTKYYIKGKKQKAKADVELVKESMVAYQVRAEVIKLLYDLYANQQIKNLTEANLRLVKDAARIAEKRYATRKSTQSDSMKAHFEITKLELQLLKVAEKKSELMSELTALLGGEAPDVGMLSSLSLGVPEVDLNLEPIQVTPPLISLKQTQVEVARHDKNLAINEFAPDFQVQYQERFSGQPEDSSIFSINASIPLWFWSETSDLSSKRAKLSAENSRLSHQKLELNSLRVSLLEKIRLKKKSLVIYKTTLLPQADGAFRTTKKSYSVGTLRFLDLLDAERSLIQVKTDFFNELVQYVQMIVYFETVFGSSISNLYFIDGSSQ